LITLFSNQNVKIHNHFKENTCAAYTTQKTLTSLYTST